MASSLNGCSLNWINIVDNNLSSTGLNQVNKSFKVGNLLFLSLIWLIFLFRDFLLIASLNVGYTFSKIFFFCILNHIIQLFFNNGLDHCTFIFNYCLVFSIGLQDKKRSRPKFITIKKSITYWKDHHDLFQSTPLLCIKPQSGNNIKGIIYFTKVTICTK